MVGVVAARGGAIEQTQDRSWRFRPAEAIVPGRNALKLLGGGDRYEAYVAWDERLHLEVVAKILRPQLVDDPRARAAIAAEAEALERLQHPVLVRSFGADLDGDRPHLVLEFLDGPRLSTLIRKFGPLAAEQLVPLARRICSALQFMAGEGWVHLDVKPRNVVMTSSPRLIDLSVARRIDAARQISRPVGTDAYMAPEQCDPTRFTEIGPPADVWGLGATLFEALTGRQAFPSDTSGRFPQLRVGPPSLPHKAPPALADAIRACLEDRPADRPTAGDLDELLEPLGDWSARAIRRLR
ncbi:MAG: serine/threonine-protein kinase [Chloroflexota bacterium]